MLKVILDIFSNFIITSTIIYNWHLLQNKKIDFKNHKLYVSLLMVPISIMNQYFNNNYLKIILITIISCLFFKYLFKETIQKTIITPIFVQLIIMISELIYALIMISLFNYDANTIMNNCFQTFLTNFIISIISILLINLGITKKIYKTVLSITDKITKIHLFIFCFIVIIISNVFAIIVYYRIEFKYLLIFSVILTILFSLIIAYSFFTQNNYNKVSNKYSVAINSLRDYEGMMKKYRIANHENKNLLLTVRAMVLNKEKNIPEYIDSIVKTKYNDDEKLLLQMAIIPSGGLRATIYSEILKISKNKIKYNLNIGSEVKTADLIELDTNTIVDACKIIGVFIDNAIEALSKLNTKIININLYVEAGNLKINILNNYTGYINIQKISNPGYTTKGRGHGYGLSLVKSIIYNNIILGNETNVTKDTFSQTLIIKL